MPTQPCPHCYTAIEITPELQGRDVECPSCGREFTAPAGARRATVLAARTAPPVAAALPRPSAPSRVKAEEPPRRKRRIEEDDDEDEDDEPKPKRKKKGAKSGGNTGVIIGAAVVGLLVIGGGIVAAVMLSGDSKKPVASSAAPAALPVAGIPVATPTPTDSWVTFNFPDQSGSIQFPKQPMPVPMPSGPGITVNSYGVRELGQTDGYLLIQMKPPANFPADQMSRVQNEMKSRMRLMAPGNVKRESNVTHAHMSGTEYEVDIQSGGTIIFRILVDRTPNQPQLFILFAGGKSISAADRQRFMSSLTVKSTTGTPGGTTTPPPSGMTPPVQVAGNTPSPGLPPPPTFDPTQPNPSTPALPNPTPGVPPTVPPATPGVGTPPVIVVTAPPSMPPVGQPPIGVPPMGNQPPPEPQKPKLATPAPLPGWQSVTMTDGTIAANIPGGPFGEAPIAIRNNLMIGRSLTAPIPRFSGAMIVAHLTEIGDPGGRALEEGFLAEIKMQMETRKKGKPSEPAEKKLGKAEAKQIDYTFAKGEKASWRYALVTKNGQTRLYYAMVAAKSMPDDIRDTFLNSVVLGDGPVGPPK